MLFHKYWAEASGDARANGKDYTIGEVAGDYQYDFDLGLAAAVDAVVLLDIGQSWSDGSTSWLRVS